ncbi:hypothetical protein SAMN05216241_102142 [Limimonas halophila]|uniref:Uncharacterized protein n=1 Tax=Limimonas halophila TaxID=1082479 RepID=A0A1G7NF00_9PROT|nr:hypothetical protein [Limimonas halophila]SDF72536.1 hypothetical protein SAMN05216241_102142 [Limimonas halophila]
MTLNLPKVAQPGGATVTPVRGATAGAATIRHRPADSGRPSATRRTETTTTPYTVFCGYSPDMRRYESMRTAEIAWCERECEGLWRLVHGPYIPGHGHEVRFAFTEKADAEAFLNFRQMRRARQEEISASRDT